MQRRDFVRVLGGVFVAGAATGAVAGCGGDDGGGGSPDSGGGGDNCSSQISANHGHAIQVPMADVDAGAERTYDISGSAGHSHSITITAAQFGMLAGGTPVTVTSTSGAAHTHSVTVTC
jgi:hypothetical protein